MATAEAERGVDQWVSLPALWEDYEGLLCTRGERNRPRYIFVDGRLTVVSPGAHHEFWKTRLGALLETLLVELGIDFHAAGGVTLLTTVRPRTGVEADETYYLTHIDRIVGKKELVMGQDPPPDLVVEVVVSHPEHDAVAAYRTFGVREVWLCKDGGLEFLVLGADGEYARSRSSALLPFLLADEFAPWVYRQDPTGERRVRLEFRAWVEATLAPRHRPEADA
jgi:Uma2 family endonuclease